MNKSAPPPNAAAGYQNITVEVAGKHAWVTLCRPEKMNPLDWDTIREIKDAVTYLDTVPELRTVAFTGTGRAFSAGGDLEKYLTLFRDGDSFRGFMEDWYAIFERMEASSKIFIAAINGVCVAGGLELLLACDLVVAAEGVRIGDGHLNFGQLPGAGSSVRLWRAIGHARAKQMMLTGELVDAAEAERIGLVGKVVPASELHQAVTALAASIEAKTPVGVAFAKSLLNNAIKLDYIEALRSEIATVERYATTQSDPIEGLMAFREKRKPRFQQP